MRARNLISKKKPNSLFDDTGPSSLPRSWRTVHDRRNLRLRNTEIEKGPETEKGETGCCLELNGGPGACDNLEVIAWLMHSIGGFPLTSWLERQHLVSSSADLECSTTTRRKAAARLLSTLTNLAKQTETTKQTTTIYPFLKKENRISTNEFSKVNNRTSENCTEIRIEKWTIIFARIIMILPKCT